MSHRQKIILIISLIFGSIIFSLPLIRSGLNYSFGIGFWGPSGHDMIWHLELINHIKNWNNIPLASFSGQQLQNYHPLYDLLVFYIHQITSMPTSLLVFQIIPITTSFIYLLLSFLIGQKISNKYIGGISFFLFNLISGSFGWIYTLITQGKLAGESIFWSMQSASFQTNPPLILSLIFIEILILFILYEKNTIFTILLLCLLPITKIYGGVAGYLIWGFYSLFSLSQKKYRPLIYLLTSLPFALVLFSQYNTLSTSLIEFSPLWFVKNLFSSPDKLFFPKLSSAINTYSLTNNIKLYPILVVSTLIFFIGNFGLRLIGFLNLFKSKTPFTTNLFLSLTILSIIPLLIIQKGTPWNTIQFIYYSLFFLNLLSAIFVSQLKPKFLNIFLFFFVTTSILGNIDTYHGFLGNPPPTAIPTPELSALQFLSNQSKGLVLTYPYDPNLKDSFKFTPIPLYSYETNAYVSAYTKQYTFLADEMNLNNSGYPWQSRLSDSQKFFKQKNIFEDRGFLVNNLIDYIYLTGLQIPKTNLDITNLYLTQIYHSQDTVIYRVNR